MTFWTLPFGPRTFFHGDMENREDRRGETRLAVDSPAVMLGGRRGHVACPRQGAESGRRRNGAALADTGQPGMIVWCAVPSYGMYCRAQVVHVRGLLFRIAGVRSLAGQILGDQVRRGCPAAARRERVSRVSWPWTTSAKDGAPTRGLTAVPVVPESKAGNRTGCPFPLRGGNKAGSALTLCPVPPSLAHSC